MFLVSGVTTSSSTAGKIMHDAPVHPAICSVFRQLVSALSHYDRNQANVAFVVDCGMKSICKLDDGRRTTLWVD